ncbi:MAG: neutral ceramidase, partial [Myxococcota bacterium]
AAGDISPNDRWNWRRWLVVGRGETDHESALINGRIQADGALKASENAAVIDGPIHAAMRRVDFNELPVPPRFALGNEGQRTSIGKLGLPMAGGTAEGPGPIRPLVPLVRLFSAGRSLVHRLSRRAGDNKLTFVEVGAGDTGKLLGIFPMRKAINIVARFEPMISWVKGANDAGFFGDMSWTPHVVPLQLIRIGPVVIAALPVEPTTVSGSRMRAVLKDALAKDALLKRGLSDCSRVIINGYCNAYTGYATTPEEYGWQRYESGYTLFGPWTLGAYCHELEKFVASWESVQASDPVEGPAEDPFDMEFLIQQRVTGRQGVAKHRGAGLTVPRLAGTRSDA